MFADFLKRLTAPEPAPLNDDDARLALSALLVRIAFADRNYQASEIGQIDRILAKTFDLNPIEAAKLRATCEALERDAPGTPEFAKILREEIDYVDRKAMGDAMWAVALADGERDEAEEASLIDIETALGLTELDIQAARETALRKL